MSDNTIVIYTADHGELGGAHGMSGKGATAYREQQNVPFIISHPAYAGGKRCKAVTSHVDIADNAHWFGWWQSILPSQFAGKDISPLLRDPASASFDAIRPGAFYNYSMLAFVDGGFFQKYPNSSATGGNPRRIRKKTGVPTSPSVALFAAFTMAVTNLTVISLRKNITRPNQLKRYLQITM